MTIHRIYSLLGYKRSVIRKVANYLFFAFFASFFAVFIGRRSDNIFIYHVGPLTQAIPGLLVKKLFKKKLFVWTLDVWPDSVYAYGFKKTGLSSFILDKFVSTIYRNCTSVFVSCKGFKKKILKYSPESKVIFSPQWVPTDMNFESAISNPAMKEGINFTFAGNIGTVQNLENVIKGFSLVKKGIPGSKSAYLNIIGDGSNLDALKNLVDEQGIKNVFFWGRRPLAEMPTWFEGSDALIISLIDQPVFSLTVPAKFQAYLAAGKPIICLMKGEVAALVQENDIGFIADPNDIAGIKQIFEKFSSISKEDRERLKSNMYRLLSDEYNREIVIRRKTEEIFG
ncbi:glycosyltransferase family 4 protein [bacterium]|nr:glycosyltransferase family 4 protein [bacterium]